MYFSVVKARSTEENNICITCGCCCGCWCEESACFFLMALICRRALNGALQIGQLFAWYLSESAHVLQRQRCRHGRISVSRISDIQITHSEPLSSRSSSYESQNDCCNFTSRSLKPWPEGDLPQTKPQPCVCWSSDKGFLLLFSAIVDSHFFSTSWVTMTSQCSACAKLRWCEILF